MLTLFCVSECTGMSLNDGYTVFVSYTFTDLCAPLWIRLFIGAIHHKAFNGNHQWCCNPNPFRSLLYSPSQFDGAVVIMSACLCACVEKVCVCLTQHYHSITGAGFCSHSLPSVVCLFMHVCVCMCVYVCVCTVLFAQLQTQHSALLIHRAVSPDKSTQSC